MSFLKQTELQKQQETQRVVTPPAFSGIQNAIQNGIQNLEGRLMVMMILEGP